MTNLHTIIARSEKFLGDNSPLILTGIGAAGVITTAFLTGKATIKATELVQYNTPYIASRELVAGQELKPDRYLYEKHSKGDIVKLTWKLYIPAAGSATVTIAAIVLANRIGSRRLAALAAAYAVSETALGDYKEKVIEKIGGKKAKEVTDEIAQDKLKGVSTTHVHVGEGEVLMMDTYTTKTFSSTMERVRKVENDLRELLLNHGETVTCSDWLKGIGLRATPYSSDFGWNGESGFKLDYTAGLTDDNLPCLVWHFAIEPRYKPVPVDRFQI